MKKFAILLGLALSCVALTACVNKATSEPVADTSAQQDYKGEVSKAK